MQLKVTRKIADAADELRMQAALAGDSIRASMGAVWFVALLAVFTAVCAVLIAGGAK